MPMDINKNVNDDKHPIARFSICSMVGLELKKV